MLQVLIGRIRGAGRCFRDLRRRTSDGGKAPRRDLATVYRAALSASGKLLLVAVALNAFAVRAQTATIVASGQWNLAVSIPMCSFAEQLAIGLTYANGAYSVTAYTPDSKTWGGSVCQSEGPQSCAATDFYRSGQDLLSASQFEAMLNAMVVSCMGDPSGDIGSLSILSPDSVSATSGSDSLQMTRVVPSPTSYALAVASAGTGYGNVASSPAGISCYVPEPNVSYLVAADCSESYAAGTSVVLNASVTAGSAFAGWSGACSGTGACSVTMDAAKNVTARFEPAPFAVSVSGVTNGLITTPVATVGTTITFNAADVGKAGSVFVTAWVPYGALSALGIPVAANAKLSVTSTLDDPTGAGAAKSVRVTHRTLAATDPNSFVLVERTASGWQLVNGQLIPYASGVLGDQLASQTILSNTDTTGLKGGQFCLGYGSSATEMLAAGRTQLIATVPDPNATSAAAGTCLAAVSPNVTLKEYYDATHDTYFYSALPDEQRVVESGAAGNWAATGKGWPVWLGLENHPSGSFDVCRFRGDPAQGATTHFYTALPEECDGIKRGNPPWLLYDGVGFYAHLPQGAGCPAGTIELRRAYNSSARNHRFLPDAATVSEMSGRGWMIEGIALCVGG